jgi:hypothetical protein
MVRMVFLLTLFLLGASNLFAQAPARSGQPYAEAVKCAASGVILCEDFDYPANFPCSGGVGTWVNPGLNDNTPDGASPPCAGMTFPATSGFPAQPAGSPPGGFVKRVDVAVGAGYHGGCLWSDCNRTTTDNPSGATYTNGLAITNDLYVRFQVFFSDVPAYKWPAFDHKIFFMWPDKYIDKPSAVIDAGWYFDNLWCQNINRGFNDGLTFRVGDNSCSFKNYPGDNSGTCHPEHQEYCLGTGYGNTSPAISQTDPPDDTPFPGTGFRFQRGKWYTFEYRYKLGSPGVQDGTIEAWINGVKVYSDSNLATCGSGIGGCSAITEIVQYFWYNAFQEGGGLQGYALADNLIISKNPIGVPAATANRYVDGTLGADCTTGNYSIANRTCTGTDGNAYRTFNLVAPGTVAGDTVHIRAGTYAAGLDCTSVTCNDGTANSKITWKNYLAETVTINGTWNFLDQDVQHWIVKGSSRSAFVWDMNKSGTQNQCFQLSETTANQGSDNMTFDTLTCRETNQDGVIQRGNNNVYRNILFVDNGDLSDSPATHAMNFSENNDGNLVENCEFTDPGDYAIAMSDTTDSSVGNIIKNNIFRDNSANTGFAEGPIALRGQNQAQVYNNVMYDFIVTSGASGIIVMTASTGVEIYNNTIYGNGNNTAITIDSGASGTILRNNLIWNWTTNVTDNGTGTVSSNNLCNATSTHCQISTGDPLLASVGTDNYHLTSSSPAINAGTTISLFNNDFDGDIRPQSSAWDIGFDEFLGTVPLAIYVDGTLGADCTTGNYSIANRTCTGSDGKAYRTLNLAAPVAVAGDTVKIRSGTYAAGLDCQSVTCNSGTGWNNTIKWQNYLSETVTINDRINFFDQNKQYVEFIGLIIDQNGTAEECWNLGESVSLGSPDFIRIKNCTCKNAATTGVIIEGNNVEFIGNLFLNVGARIVATHHGIYVSANTQSTPTNILIDGNTFDNVTGGSVHVNGESGGMSSGIIVRNNIIKNVIWQAGDTQDPLGIYLHDTNNSIAYNNLIYDIAPGVLGCISVGGASGTGNQVINNTCYGPGLGSGGNGIETQPGVSSTVIKNNFVWNWTTSINNSGSATTSSTNLCNTTATCQLATSEPGFADVSGDDYRLTTTSAAVNAGQAVTAFSTDIVGTNRPQGIAWDIGAYEYLGLPGSITVLSPNGGGSVQVDSTISITWASNDLGGPASQTFNVDGTWISPITGNVAADVWGAGGGGGGNNTTADGGGGGGGGAFSRETGFLVSSGLSYTVEVGSGGVGGVGLTDGGLGGDSWFKDASTVMAKGGAGGGRPISGAAGIAGAGGAAASGVGDSKFSGGIGGDGNNNNAGVGGGGGGSAGSAGAGGNGVNRAAGPAGAGTPSGAAGGGGGDNTPSAGNAPGGGGGGGGDPSDGAAGAPGRVVLTWNTAGTVDIELSRNGGVDWELIANDTENDGQFDWVVAGSATSQALIRVTHTGGGGESDISDNTFTITATATGTLTIVSPTDGQKFKQGEAVPVGWTSSNVSGNVRIDVSWDNGASWDTVVQSTPFNTPAQVWIAHSPASSLCKVRVVSLNDQNVVGESSGNFRVRGNLVFGAVR